MSTMLDFLAEHVGPGVVILKFRPPRKRKSIEMAGAVLYANDREAFFAPIVGGVIRLKGRQIVEGWAFPDSWDELERRTYHNAFILWSITRGQGWPFLRYPPLEFELEEGVRISALFDILPLLELLGLEEVRV